VEVAVREGAVAVNVPDDGANVPDARYANVPDARYANVPGAR
jgi:hypothetical protein